MISHSVFPPANLISEPVGALVALGVILGAERFTRDSTRKDSLIGYLLVVLSSIGLVVFGVLVVLRDLKPEYIPAQWTSLDGTLKIVVGLAFVVLLIIGLYLIPNILRKYKAGVTALIATLASGFTFATVAALVIVEAPNYLSKAAPPVDAFILGLLPIVIGCAVVNFVIARCLTNPRRKQ